MNEERANLYRWIVSAAVVVLLHGGVVVALLKWHNVLPAGEPFMMDLAPWMGAPLPDAAGLQASASQQGGPQPAAANGAERAAASAQPAARGATETAARDRADSGGSSAAPEGKGSEARTANHGGGFSQGAPSLGHESGHGGGVATGVMPISPTPPASAAVPSGSAPAAGSTPLTGPAATANAPAPNGPTLTATNPFSNSPIDTSITVQPWLHGRKGVAALNQKGGLSGIDQKGHIMFRPLGHAGEPPHPGTLNLPVVLNSLGTLTLPGATATRTPGAHVQDRARAAATRQVNAIGTAAPGARGGGNTAGTVATNAIGIAAPSTAGKGGANAPGGVATNAIGIAIRLPSNTAATKSATERNAPSAGAAATTGEHNASSVALVGPGQSGASAVNGRTMIRAGAAAGTIGGPARRASSGVISGSDVHPKVP